MLVKYNFSNFSRKENLLRRFGYRIHYTLKCPLNFTTFNDLWELCIVRDLLASVRKGDLFCKQTVTYNRGKGAREPKAQTAGAYTECYAGNLLEDG